MPLTNVPSVGQLSRSNAAVNILSWLVLTLLFRYFSRFGFFNYLFS
jgi:hypothetical protein